MSKKKYLFLIILLALTLLISVGMATWIIITQSTLSPNPFPTDGSKKITPTIITTPELSQIYQGEQTSISSDGLANVPGSWTVIEDTKLFTYNANGTTTETDEQEATVKFTPDNANLYNPVEVDVKFKMNPIAYNISGNTRVYYGTVESAITSSTSGTIYVYSSDVAPLAISEIARTIKSDCTIASNVTLCLPWEGTKAIPAQETVATHESLATNTSSYKYKPAENAYTNLVIVDDDVTLTNNGTLTIGGVVSGGSGGYIYNSCTVVGTNGTNKAAYAQITMGKNATINSSASSNINCYGYIREKTKDNNSKVNIYESSSIIMPFNVVEHRGGGVFAAMSNLSSGQLISLALQQNVTASLTSAPFSRFYFSNISSILTIDSSSKMYGYADLYAGDQHNITNINFVGNSSNFLFQMNSGSIFSYKYDIGTKVMDFTIAGSTRINTLSLTVSASSSLGNISLGTGNVLFPISWHWNITFAKSNAIGNTNTIDCTTSGQSLKLLPGSKITIENDVTLYVNSLYVYNNTLDDSSVIGTDNGTVAKGNEMPYNEDNTGTLYTNPAEICINGTLNANNFDGNGIITSTQNGGKIIINDSTSVEAKELSSYVARSSIGDILSNGLGKAFYADNSENITLSLPAFDSEQPHKEVGVYYSKIVGKDSYWAKEDAYFDLKIVHKGPSADSVIIGGPETGVYYINQNPILGNPTCDGWKFAGWFADAACTPENQITTINGVVLFQNSSGDGSATIYGKWVTDNVYNLAFNTALPSNSTDALTLNTIVVASGSTFNPYTNEEIKTKTEAYYFNDQKQYYFGGWYTDANLTNRVNEDTGAVVSSNTTLYAKWIEKRKVTFVSSAYNSGDRDLGINGLSYYVIDGTTIVLPTATIYDNDAGADKYFAGWSSNQTEFSTTITSYTTFTANWKQKIKVTFVASGGYPNDYPTTISSTYGQVKVSSYSNWGTKDGTQEVYIKPSTDNIIITFTASSYTRSGSLWTGYSYSKRSANVNVNGTKLNPTNDADNEFTLTIAANTADGTEITVTAS